MSRSLAFLIACLGIVWAIFGFLRTATLGLSPTRIFILLMDVACVFYAVKIFTKVIRSK